MLDNFAQMIKIYTKKGDKGYTTILNNSIQLPKHHPIINFLGNMDELSCVLGVLKSLIKESKIVSKDKLYNKIFRIQKEIYQINASVAGANKHKFKNFKGISQTNIKKLELEIDNFTDELEPLKNFVIPGDNLINAITHIARAVCRRAERSLSELSQTQNVDTHIIAYINRLSDWLFILARIINKYL